MSLHIPIIAIVGRPNVGKSTFFNRVNGEKLAVVEDEPGVTRDRNYSYVGRFSIPFYLVDTGGFEKGSLDTIQQQVSLQAVSAVEEADMIIFMVDNIVGLHSGDEDVLHVLRRHDKPFCVVANKCDGKELEAMTAEFYQMGVDQVYSCSALHGRGINPLIEEILHKLPFYNDLKNSVEDQKLREEIIQAELENEFKQGFAEMDQAQGWFEEDAEDRHDRLTEKTIVELEEDDFAPVFDPESDDDLSEYEDDYTLLPVPSKEGRLEEEDSPLEEEIEIELPVIRVAIIGRPNVGKSTLLNAITHKERAITSPIAGTTRDSIHEMFEYEGQKFELIDTAGMRKKGRIGDAIERYSVLRSLRSISECDVAIVVLDAIDGPTEQDGKIVGLAHEQGKGIVIVVNKWDAIEKDHKSVKTFEEKIRQEFKFTPYAPLYFISAKSGRRVNRPIEAALDVAKERRKRIGTHSLNNLLKKELPRASAPTYRGRKLKLYYAAQVDVAPPRFMLVMNYPKEAHFSYLRFIKNVIRERYGFSGTDIKLVTKKRSGGPDKSL
jgi:GTP-binding protein